MKNRIVGISDIPLQDEKRNDTKTYTFYYNILQDGEVVCDRFKMEVRITEELFKNEVIKDKVRNDNLERILFLNGVDYILRKYKKSQLEKDEKLGLTTGQQGQLDFKNIDDVPSVDSFEWEF